MSRQLALSAQKVKLDLTEAERTLILEQLFIFDGFLLRPIARAAYNQPIEMPLDDVDDLTIYLERELRRDFHKELRPEVRRLLRKVREFVDAHAARTCPSPKQAIGGAEPGFPLRYSQAQRRAIAECLPELAGRLKLDERNIRVIQLTLGEMRLVKRRARQAACRVDSGMKRNSLMMVIEATCEALEKFEEGSILRIGQTERLYQFRISLVGLLPEIWRRIQVKECTLDRLHEHVQLAFGWWNYHLHQFQIGDITYGAPWLLSDPVEEVEFEDSTQTRLCDIMPKSGQRFRFQYKYDFGDCWEHEILFEGCLRAEKHQRYPKCLEGRRACPPEDVGGVDGYYRYLESMADPEHEEHEDFMAWRGPYDPDKFDAEKTTKTMRRGMPKPVDDGM